MYYFNSHLQFNFVLTSAAAAGLASAAAGAIGSGLSSLSASKTNRKSYSYSSALMRQQNALNLDNWRLQQAYNTPSAQMQRYSLAGINPNSIYGESQQMSSGYSNASPASVSNSQFKAQPVLNGSELANASRIATDVLFDSKLKSSEADVNLSQVSKNMAETRLSLAKAGYTEKELAGFDDMFSHTLAQMASVTDANYAKIDQAYSNISNINVDTKYKDVLLRYASDMQDAILDNYRSQTSLNSSRQTEISSKLHVYSAEVQSLLSSASRNYEDIKLMSSQQSLNTAKVAETYKSISQMDAVISNLASKTNLTDKEVRWFVFNQICKGVSTAAGAFRDIGVGFRGFKGPEKFY